MDQLKRVPRRTRIELGGGQDARQQFFIDNMNSNKYYYLVSNGGRGDPYNNTLRPLGRFIGFRNIVNNPHVHYYLRFENAPFNGNDEFSSVYQDANIVYTDNPPAAGSVPLHYYDYIAIDPNAPFDENGRPVGEIWPNNFGDGENGANVQVLRPPDYESPLLQSSRNIAHNYVKKNGGKTNKKNKKGKKQRKQKTKRFIRK